MQLNVLKKAYTAKTSKLDQRRSIESLDQVCNLFKIHFNIMIIYLSIFPIIISLKAVNMIQCQQVVRKFKRLLTKQVK